MHDILGYIQDYWKSTDKLLLALVTAFTGLIVFINYRWQLDVHLSRWQGFSRWAGYTILYSVTYGLPFLLCIACNTVKAPFLPLTLLVLVIAALFAFKVSSTSILSLLEDLFKEKNPAYWSRILNTPVKLLLLTVAIWLVWRYLKAGTPVLGLAYPENKHIYAYLIMLGIMIPLIAVAAMLPSFIDYYPKFSKLPLPEQGFRRVWMIFLYELSYATDFIGIELFFRGLLAIGMVHFAGPMAILPMAAFYCSIHFGKPLGECISSFFGGLLLGILAWRTKSIAGGLFIHIGIAWLMEIAGYLGNRLK
ncbi:MAG: CPBP family intramembrane glutamic endopeptidase [Chitinophagaceae bacterium]